MLNLALAVCSMFVCISDRLYVMFLLLSSLGRPLCLQYYVLLNSPLKLKQFIYHQDCLFISLEDRNNYVKETFMQ